MSKYVIRLNRVWDSGFSLSLAFSLSKCRCDITTLRFFHLRCNHHFIAGPLFFHPNVFVPQTDTETQTTEHIGGETGYVDIP